MNLARNSVQEILTRATSVNDVEFFGALSRDFESELRLESSNLSDSATIVFYGDVSGTWKKYKTITITADDGVSYDYHSHSYDSIKTEISAISGGELSLLARTGEKIKTKPLSSIVYEVSDTSITDHGDSTISGSIAKALSDADAAGGGRVNIGPGTYTITSAALQVGQDVSLYGAGQGVTIIDQTHATNNAIEVGSGTNFQPWRGILSGMTINLPTSGTPGSCVVLAATQASGGDIERLRLEGGNASSWGIRHGANNQTSVRHVNISGGMNGWEMDLTGASFNYGDNIVQDVTIFLTLANTTGFKINGISGATSNNILFNRISASGNDSAGQKGIHLVQYASRHTFSHVDIESMEQDIVIDTNDSTDNTFIGFVRPTSFGAISNDYTYFGNQVFIGGDNDYKAITTVRPVSSAHTAIATATTLSKFSHGGKTINNTGATASVTYTLPDANSDNAGVCQISFFAHVAQPMALALADVGDRIVDTTGAQRTTWTSTGVIGESITLESVSFKWWRVVSQTGTWS